MLYHHGLTGCGSLRASCGFCACPAVRGQCVRCILRLLISGPFCRLCGSLAAVDRGQGVCPSWCRSGSQRLPWCVSCAPGFGPLLLSVRRVSAAHGAWSDAVLCRQLCGVRSHCRQGADHRRGFFGSRPSLLSLFMGLLSLLYRSSVSLYAIPI